MKSLSTLDMYCESKYRFLGCQNATKKTTRRTDELKSHLFLVHFSVLFLAIFE